MTSGTISLPTYSAINLWKHELTGQFSDGMWENSGPEGHYRFWCDLEVIKGLPGVETDRPWSCQKTGYRLGALYEVVGDRMVNLGRMGEALGKVVDYQHHVAAEYMPATFQEFLTATKETAPGGNYLGHVTQEEACAYYATVYTMRDLKDDMRAVKKAMHSLDNRR